MKAFADNKINITKKLKLGLEKVENIVGKWENAGYHPFLFFPQCFQKPSFFFKVVKSQDCVVKSLPFTTQSQIFNTSRKRTFHKMFFYPLKEKCSSFFHHLFRRLQMLKILKYVNKNCIQSFTLIFFETGGCQLNLQHSVNTFPNDNFLTFPNWKSLQTTISNLMKMAESYQNG